MIKAFARIRGLFHRSSGQAIDTASQEIQYVAALVRLFDEIKDVPGHILEIGTGSGRNALILGNLIRTSGQSAFRRYYGFDTFSGYTTADLESSPYLRPSAHIYSQQQTESRLHSANLGGICSVFPGDISDVLPSFVSSPPVGAKFSPYRLRIALLYLDCNSYRAARRSLEVLGPYLSQGAVVAVDETIQGGETQALAEWCRKEKHDLQAGHFGGVISSFARIHSH